MSNNDFDLKTFKKVDKCSSDRFEVFTKTGLNDNFHVHIQFGENNYIRFTAQFMCLQYIEFKFNTKVLTLKRAIRAFDMTCIEDGKESASQSEFYESSLPNTIGKYFGFASRDAMDVAVCHNLLLFDVESMVEKEVKTKLGLAAQHLNPKAK